ncbi:polysaccharide biosynthesis tyrosine autokinase [Deinococcus sonorensis]|uniref:P-loop NTPase n=2 Tax=Deinococcus sonorensis TaxID=309891 RepID=A0AAU7UCW3_9DEIO
MQSNLPTNEDFDFPRLLMSVRRHALPILSAALLAGAGTYYLSSQQPPVYEAVSSAIASRPDTSGGVVGSNLVSAPQLPQGAVDKAIHSRDVIEDIIRRLNDSTELSAPVKADLSRRLRSQLQGGSFPDLQVSALTDGQQAGIYELHVKAGTPVAARVLADTSLESLLAWDLGRAQRRIAQAKNSLQAQLDALTSQLGQRSTGPNASLEVQTLAAARAQVQQNLLQVRVLESAATGSLDTVSQAVEPNKSVSPRPVRSGVLAALLTLLLASGAALLTDSLRRRVHGEQDLAGYGVPFLGKLPRLSAADLKSGMVEAARSGSLYMGAGFLRVNLLSQLPAGKPRRIVVSSARPGEGKSSVTAVLAASLAASGLRVLVVDADMHRPSQPQLWRGFGNPLWRIMPSCRLNAIDPTKTLMDPAQTLPSALDRLDEVQVMAVAENIDLLPAGRPMKDSSGVIGHPRLAEALDRWGAAYDVVLIDTPPMLVLADAMAFAHLADGVVLVAEAGSTSGQEIQSALNNARVTGARILGIVLNKQVRSEDKGTYYDYSYRMEGSTPVRPAANDTRLGRHASSSD